MCVWSTLFDSMRGLVGIILSSFCLLSLKERERAGRGGGGGGGRNAAARGGGFDGQTDRQAGM